MAEPSIAPSTLPLNRPLKVGPVALPTNLFLAPIAGYTDLAFRLIARRFGGLGLGCTDLICVHAVLRQMPKTMVLMQTCDEDRPLAVQLFGAEDDPMGEAARRCIDAGAQVIDINMGCPVDKITRQARRLARLRDPDATVRMMEKLVASVPGIPVTAKLRLGWNDEHIVAPYLARHLEEVGVQTHHHPWPDDGDGLRRRGASGRHRRGGGGRAQHPGHRQW